MAPDKKQRQLAVANLVKKNKIANQKELQNWLLEYDIKATQATLSRDLQEMGIRKVKLKNDRTGYYRLPEDLPEEFTNPDTSPTYGGTRGYRAMSYSGNIIVIKAKPGYAHSICVDIDNLRAPELAGTIAGDDTIFILIAEGSTREEALQVVAHIVPEVLIFRP